MRPAACRSAVVVWWTWGWMARARLRWCWTAELPVRRWSADATGGIAVPSWAWRRAGRRIAATSCNWGSSEGSAKLPSEWILKTVSSFNARLKVINMEPLQDVHGKVSSFMCETLGGMSKLLTSGGAEPAGGRKRFCKCRKLQKAMTLTKLPSASSKLFQVKLYNYKTDPHQAAEKTPASCWSIHRWARILLSPDSKHVAASRACKWSRQRRECWLVACDSAKLKFEAVQWTKKNFGKLQRTLCWFSTH